MGRIASTFKRLGKVNEAALMIYVTVGYPTLLLTRQLVPVMARQGADLIELGVPSGGWAGSGAAIRRAASYAFDIGVSISDCLSVSAEARRANEIPLLLRGYYGPIRDYGIEKLAAHCAASGVDGLVVPDLSINNAADLQTACRTEGVDLILQVLSSADDDYLQRVTEMASGFIYCVPDTGDESNEESSELIKRISGYTDLPVVVASGIGTPQQVGRIISFADGIAFDEAIADLIVNLAEDDIFLSVAELVRELKEATTKSET